MVAEVDCEMMVAEEELFPLFFCLLFFFSMASEVFQKVSYNSFFFSFLSAYLVLFSRVAWDYGG